VEVTHPFHPLRGQQYELVRGRTSCRGESLVVLRRKGRVIKLPLAWTSAHPVDPYVLCAPEQTFFRLPDLLAVAELVRVLTGEEV